MRRAPVLASMSLALLACAPAPARPPAGDPARLELARLEAAREPGSAAIIARADEPVSADSLLAIRALGRAADPPAIARLVALLRDPDPQRRAAAAEALGHAGLLAADVTAAEPALLAALPAATTDRPAILTALGRLGTAAAVPALAAALDTTWPEDQRDAAAIALGVLGRRKVAFDDRARSALLALARDPARTYPATYALAHEPDPPVRDADPALADLAGHADPEVRFLALTGLSRRKSAAELARPRFAAGLRDRDFRVAVAAVRGLAGLADDDSLAALAAWLVTALRDMPPGTGTIHPVLEALSLFSARPGPPRPELAALAREYARRPAADPLVHARIACALAAQAARPPDWRPPLQCTDELEQKTAETLLIRHGFGGSPDQRLARLLDLAADRDVRVRLAALSALAAQWSELDRPELPDLFSRLIADGPTAVAGAAAEAVQTRWSATPRPPLPDRLLRSLLARAARERDGELFAGLAAALAATGDPSALPPCRDALAHHNFTVRAAARACVTALAGADPGPALASGPSPLPPHDPAALAGPVLWRLTTTRGVVDIELDPQDAPWHVAAVVALTRRGFYDGLPFHRVVPGFVVQGGDPDGTGWGGPGFNLPSEPGGGRFDAGAVGIADAGKDTGGSQFFVMHARAPHLEGRYTRIGRVRAGLDIAIALVVGDAIVRAELRD